MTLTLRLATLDDASRLFGWRNDLETRCQSKRSGEVSWEEHLRWFEESRKNLKRILCIAESEGKPVGTIRADEREDGYTEISYTIAPESRGQGLSKPMVVQFVDEFLSGRRLAAKIKKGHYPSESVARALGLSPFLEERSEDPSDPRPMVEWR